MNNESQHPDSGRLAVILQRLTASAQQVARGNYDAAKHFFQVTGSESEMPELRALAETCSASFLMMKKWDENDVVNDGNLEREHHRTWQV